MFKNRLSLLLWVWVEKTVPEVETSNKEKVSYTVISKGGHTDSLLGAWNHPSLLISLIKVQQ